MTKLWHWWCEHWVDFVMIALVLWFLYAQRQLVIHYHPTLNNNNCPQDRPDIRQTYKI